MDEGYLDIEGKKIWYSVYGKEKKNTPIFVVHGGPGFSSMPEVVCEFGEQRPVYFYDQLGSRRSDKAKSKDDYSVEYFVAELEGVIKALQFTDIILMGFSWGCGLIGSYMLEKKPAGVKALILSAPFLSTSLWDRDQREHITKMPSAIIKAIENGETSGDYAGEYQTAMMAYYNRHVCRLNPWPNSLVEAFDALNMDVYQTMWGPSEFTVTGKLKGFDLYPRLHEITIPVLLTCGDNDEAGVKTVKDFQIAFPHAQMAVIPNASHLHHIEQPQIYKTVVNEFLKNQ